MYFFSIFGPNLQTPITAPNNSNQNTVRNLTNTIFSAEVQELVQHLLNSSRGQTSSETTTEETEEDVSPQNTSSGTSTEEILYFDSIPASNMTLSQVNRETTLDVNTSEEEITCVICHNVIERNSIFRKINQCGHSFHVQCIDEWLNNHSTCPTCRVDLLENQPPSVSRNGRRTSTLTFPLYSFRYA